MVLWKLELSCGNLLDLGKDVDYIIKGLLDVRNSASKGLDILGVCNRCRLSVRHNCW